MKNKKIKGKTQICAVHGTGARSYQQDSFAYEGTDCNGGIFAVVADGMGGLVNSGEVSSAIVEKMIYEYTHKAYPNDMEQLLSLYGTAVESAAELTRDNNYKSGTTLCACLIRKAHISWISSGDSRLYIWRGGAMIQLTRDHDLLRDLIPACASGNMTYSDALSNPRKDALTSYIGSSTPKYIDFNDEPVPLLKGDKVVIMSDGVYRGLSLSDMASCLSKNAKKSADNIDALIKKKNIATQDNYTALIIEIK